MKSNNSLGIFYIGLGTVFFLFFIGSFLIRIVGAIVSILVLNYGLKLMGYPPAQILFFQLLSKVKFDLFRR